MVKKKDSYGFMLPEVQVSAPKVNINPLSGIKMAYDLNKTYDYAGCAQALRQALGSGAGELLNFYGNAWDVPKSAYVGAARGAGEAQIGDLVPLYRDVKETDEGKGIPIDGRNQHIGMVVKIDDRGVPIVLDYVNGRYRESPINAIPGYKTKEIYPTLLNKSISTSPLKFSFNEGYTPNAQEKEFYDYLSKNKKKIQQSLFLDDDEFENIASLAYKVIGAESSFGASPRYALRNALPDGIEYLLKSARGNTPNRFTNSLSKGFGSVKGSSFYSIGSHDPQESFRAIRDNIEKGDYRDYDRNQTWKSRALGRLGVDLSEISNMKNSAGAVLATLADLYHRQKRDYPEKSDKDIEDALLQRYNGYNNERDKQAYLKKISKYGTHIDGSTADYPEKKMINKISENVTLFTDALKREVVDAKNKVVTPLIKHSPLPINGKGFLVDLLGDRGTVIDGSWLSAQELNTLNKIATQVKNNGSNRITYADYSTSKDAYEDVGGGTTAFSKYFSPAYSLKTFIGQGNITTDPEGGTFVTDTFDYNDFGKSFGVTDDLKKRGFTFYNLMRSIGRNYGAPDKLGAKVKIKIDDQ